MLDADWVRWISEEARKLHEQGWMPGPREAELIEHWRRARPKMCRELGQKLLKKLAFVLDDRRFQAKQAYMKAGIPPCDAEERAQREWCLREPEDDRENTAPEARGGDQHAAMRSLEATYRRGLDSYATDACGPSVVSACHAEIGAQRRPLSDRTGASRDRTAIAG
jgi:hypothetical protein